MEKRKIETNKLRKQEIEKKNSFGLEKVLSFKIIIEELNQIRFDLKDHFKILNQYYTNLIEKCNAQHGAIMSKTNLLAYQDITPENCLKACDKKLSKFADYEAICSSEIKELIIFKNEKIGGI